MTVSPNIAKEFTNAVIGDGSWPGYIPANPSYVYQWPASTQATDDAARHRLALELIATAPTHAEATRIARKALYLSEDD